MIPRKLRIILLRSLAGVLAVILGVGIYACAAVSAVRREIARTPRDPRTGVVLGTEAAALDPPKSDDPPTTAVLMIHGFLGSRKDFADLGERLAAAGFHVELMRLPGHGTTPPDARAQTPETLYRAVAAQYAELRAKYHAVYVVGFSMGGTLGTLLAAREKVDRLVLAAPYFGVTYEWFYILPPMTWNTLLGWAIPYTIKSQVFVKCNRPESKPFIYSYHCVPMRAVATLRDLGLEAVKPATLAAVHCPTLLVMADGDGAASPAAARNVYAQLQAPKQAHWLPARNNHIIFWDLDREEAKEAVVEFLKK